VEPRAAQWGDFRLYPLDGTTDLRGAPQANPPVVIEAQRTVTEVDRIVTATDIFGSATLSSPDIFDLLDGAVRISAAISFAIGTDLSPSPSHLANSANKYVAETDNDQRLLERFGIDRARLPLKATTGVETADHYPVDAQLIEALARRGAVAVYREALRTDTNIGQFRELWRTLEFAFQAHGSRLVKLLASFPPVAQLGFDRNELEALRTLRGKISHAASRSGSTELAQSGADVIKHVGRLWSLVDRVLLTKKDASPSLDVDELRPLSAFIGRDGNVQFSPSISDPEDWLEQHGITRARRFRQPEH
jgi:hypothetical protein